MASLMRQDVGHSFAIAKQPKTCWTNLKQFCINLKIVQTCCIFIQNFNLFWKLMDKLTVVVC